MAHYLTKLRELKNKPGFSIKVKKYNNKSIVLRVLTYEDLKNRTVIQNLSDWREKHSFWFGGGFKVTNARTRKWLKDLVLDKDDRILFMIEDQEGNSWGHLGFNRFDPKDNSCELDNVVRGTSGISGLMTDCVEAIVKWGFGNLKIENMYLSTYLDNKKAIALYKRCGFVQIGKVPLKRIRRDGELVWVEAEKESKTGARRYFAKFKFKGN